MEGYIFFHFIFGFCLLIAQPVIATFLQPLAEIPSNFSNYGVTRSDDRRIGHIAFLQRARVFGTSEDGVQIKSKFRGPTESPTTTKPVKVVESDEILDEYIADDSDVEVQQGEGSVKLMSPASLESGDSAAPPTFDENETLKEFYEEWLEYMLYQMKGVIWGTPGSNRGDLCSENINLKNRGCALLIPTCTNYAAAGDPTSWSCEVAVWPACRCSKPYSSFLHSIIPKAKECYGEIVNTNQLISLIPEAGHFMDRRSQALIPLGRCAWSGFFFVYWIIIGSALTAVISALWPVLRNALWKKTTVTTLTSSSSRVFRSPSQHPSTLNSARKLLVD